MFQLSWSYGFWEEDFLKMSHRFVIIPNNGVVHNFHNITFLLPGLLCTRFSWKLPSGSGEDIENVKRLRAECDQKSPLELELNTFQKLCFMRGLAVTHVFSILRARDIGSSKFYIINRFYYSHLNPNKNRKFKLHVSNLPYSSDYEHIQYIIFLYKYYTFTVTFITVCSE